jgi:hypothetical protein
MTATTTTTTTMTMTTTTTITTITTITTWRILRLPHVLVEEKSQPLRESPTNGFSTAKYSKETD